MTCNQFPDKIASGRTLCKLQHSAPIVIRHIHSLHSLRQGIEKELNDCLFACNCDSMVQHRSYIYTLHQVMPHNRFDTIH